MLTASPQGCREEPIQPRQLPRDLGQNSSGKEQNQQQQSYHWHHTGAPWPCQGTTGTPRGGDRPRGCGAIRDELAGVIMGFTDTNGLYGFNPALITQPGCLWEIQLCVQRGKKYRFIAQILLMVFLPRKKQFCFEVIWLLGASSPARGSWSILS